MNNHNMNISVFGATLSDVSQIEVTDHRSVVPHLGPQGHVIDPRGPRNE